MVAAERMEKGEALVCQGYQVCPALLDLKENLDLWGPLDRWWSGPLEQKARREPQETLLEPCWVSREPRVTEDCLDHGVKRVKLAMQESLATLGKTVKKGLQDSKVSRASQALGFRAPLAQVVLQV